MIKFNELFDCDDSLKVPNIKRKGSIPWVDKYRPKKLADVVYQEDVTKMLESVLKTGNMPHLLFYGNSGCGKCLAPETPIIMYDGSIKQAQYIKPNELVMGDNSTPRKVIGVTQGLDIMYKIIQDGSEDYVVNSKHILSLILSIQFIFVKSKKPDTYKLFWFDQHIMQKKVFRGSSHNIMDIVEDHKQWLIKNKKVNEKGDVIDIEIGTYLTMPKRWKQVYKGYKSQEITCWNHFATSKDPYQFGYSIDDTLTCIPDEYKFNDIQVRKKVIKGYLDRYQTGYIRHSSLSLFKDLSFLARSLGIRVIDNKNNTALIIENIDNYYDINIECLGEGTYCGFELDGNKRFLLGDFTVTHNTSTILSIGMELFGPKKFSERVIELNASDERGINIVRNKIVTLAKMSVGSPDPNYLCPPYKIIILDEADAMTNEAQSALRKTMEDNSSITRFCFICNYINQIIDPITSRCVKFRFKPINETNMSTKLKEIAQKENMLIEDNAINLISCVSYGDIRKAIMLLQNLNYLKDAGTTITIEDIYEVSNTIPINKLENVMSICMDNSGSIYAIKNLVEHIIKNGYPVNNILLQLTNLIIKNETINDKEKSEICLHIANTEKRLIDGADEFLQLLSVFMCIKSITNNISSIYTSNTYKKLI